MIALPEVNWKNWMKNHESLTLFNSESYAKEGNKRFELRKRAKKCMEDLPYILQNMHRVSRKPDLEFRKIFADEKLYRHMMAVVVDARFAGLIYGKPKLLGKKQIVELLLEGWRAKIVPREPTKLYSDSNFREKFIKKIREQDTDSRRRLMGLQIKFEAKELVKDKSMTEKTTEGQRIFLVVVDRDGDIISRTEVPIKQQNSLNDILD